MTQLAKENKNAKHKFDVMYKIWLRRWFVVQTSDEDDENIEQEIREIRAILLKTEPKDSS